MSSCVDIINQMVKNLDHIFIARMCIFVESQFCYYYSSTVTIESIMTNICFVDDTSSLETHGWGTTRNQPWVSDDDDTYTETFSIITCKNSTIYYFPWNSHSQYTMLILLFDFMYNLVVSVEINVKTRRYSVMTKV